MILLDSIHANGLAISARCEYGEEGEREILQEARDGISKIIRSFEISNVANYWTRSEKGFADRFPCVRLPYPVCWFEARGEILDMVSMKLTGQSARSGALVRECVVPEGFRPAEYPDIPPAYVLLLRFFHQLSSDLGKQPVVWCGGASFPVDASGALYYATGSTDPRCTIYTPGVSRTPAEKEVFRTDEMLRCCRVLAALSLLHCKNVSAREVEPPGALLKALAKRGKRPPVRYSVIEVTGAQTSGGDGSGSDRMYGRHICRGHFKQFTESNKLFGKHTGLYWWDHHLRGSAEKGVILSDYKVGEEPRA